MASNNKSSTTTTASSLFKTSNVPMMGVKKEPLPSDSKLYTTERLSSFRFPRDLTLCGLPLLKTTARPNLISNPQKKVYTPNLNAIRNKNV